MPGVRILFVEDNLVFALMNAAFLRDCGFDVTHVASAAEALAVLDRGGRLDAVVTDVHLGPGADGFAVARAAQAAYPNLRVLITSGSNRERFLSEAADNWEFLAKPFHPLQIIEALAQADYCQVA